MADKKTTSAKKINVALPSAPTPPVSSTVTDTVHSHDHSAVRERGVDIGQGEELIGEKERGVRGEVQQQPERELDEARARLKEMTEERDNALAILDSMRVATSNSTANQTREQELIKPLNTSGVRARGGGGEGGSSDEGGGVGGGGSTDGLGASLQQRKESGNYYVQDPVQGQLNKTENLRGVGEGRGGGGGRGVPGGMKSDYWGGRADDQAEPGAGSGAWSDDRRSEMTHRLTAETDRKPPIITEGEEKIIWETHVVGLSRVPVYGFGIAVSGGKDNPHFINGDPSIVISDVLRNGPADGKLMLGDRILSVNSIPLENVEHSSAISALRDCGDHITLVVRRRLTLVTHKDDLEQPFKVTLHKKKKKDDYGLSLSSKLYIDDIRLDSLAAHEGTLRQGDTILKINNTSVESLSLVDARKLLDKSKDKIQLVVSRATHVVKQPTTDKLSKVDPRHIDSSKPLYNTTPPRPPPPQPAGEPTQRTYTPSALRPNGVVPTDTYGNTLPRGEYTNGGGKPGRGDSDLFPAPPRDELEYRGAPLAGEDFKNDQRGMGILDRDRRLGDNTGRWEVPAREDGSRNGMWRDGMGDGRQIPEREYANLPIRAPALDQSLTLNDVPDRYRTQPQGPYPASEVPYYPPRGVQSSHSPPRNLLPSRPKSEIYGQQPEAGGFPSAGDYGDGPRADYPPALSSVTSPIDQMALPTAGGYIVRAPPGDYRGGLVPGERDYGAYGRLPPGRDDPFYGARQPPPSPEPRVVSFRKDGGVGIRISGGNHTGIFVAKIAQNTAAEEQGLREGDMIHKVNGVEMRDMTREEAVLMLLSLRDHVSLLVQHCRLEYDRLMAHGGTGDLFYIRTHFAYDVTEHGEMSFKNGEVFQITDTLYSGVVGSWQAIAISPSRSPGGHRKKGIIPNLSRATQLARAQVAELSSRSSSKENMSPISSSITGGSRVAGKSSSNRSSSFFKKRTAWRAKSLGKDHWDDVVFGKSKELPSTGSQATRFPAYERVALRDPGFVRPVVIFGPLADVARDKLVRELPEYFDTPQAEGSHDRERMSKSGVIKLGAIRHIIEWRKHAVLDVTPNAVDRLNYAQYAPIVIFLRAESKQSVKELRHHWARSSSKSPRKLYEQAERLEATFSHIFTQTIALTNGELWFKRLKEAIERQQKEKVWMSEFKLDMTSQTRDDVTFPTSHRLSFVSSPDSDVEASIHGGPGGRGGGGGPLYGDGSLRRPPPVTQTRKANGGGEAGGGGRGRMVRSTSDPSLVTQDDVDLYDARLQYPQDIAEMGPRSAIPYYSQPRRRPPPDPNMESVPYNDYSRDYPRGGPPPAAGYPPPARYPPNVAPQGREPISQVTPRPPNGETGHEGMREPAPLGRVHSEYIDRSAVVYGQGNLAGQGDAAYYRAGIDSYATLTPSERLRRYAPSQQQPQQQQQLQDDFRYPPPPPPHMSGLYPEPHSLSMGGGPPPPPTLPPSSSPPMGDAGSYSRSTPSNQINRHDDSKLREKFGSAHIPVDLAVSYTGSPRSADTSGLRSIDTVGSAPLDAESSFSGSAAMRGSDPVYRFTSDSTRGREKVAQTKTIEPNKQALTPLRQSNLSQSPVVKGGSTPSVPSSRNGGPVAPPKPPHLPSTKLTNGDSVVAKKTATLSTEQRNASEESAKSSDTNSDERRSSAFESYKKFFESNPLASTANEKNKKLSNQQRANDMITADDPQTLVVATARGVFDHRGGLLESKETGVSIMIPAGAIPENVQQEIYFKVCKDGSILPPLDEKKGETLLSPLVMCGPHGLKFLLPVELRLPHSASVNPESWSFALKSSDSPNGEPSHWRNMTLADQNGVSQGLVSKNSVSVLVDHF